MRGVINAANPWTEIVDLFFYRDPEDLEKSEADAEEAKVGGWGTGVDTADASKGNNQEWGNTEWGTSNDWNQGGTGTDGWDAV